MAGIHSAPMAMPPFAPMVPSLSSPLQERIWASVVVKADSLVASSQDKLVRWGVGLVGSARMAPHRADSLAVGHAASAPMVLNRWVVSSLMDSSQHVMAVKVDDFRVVSPRGTVHSRVHALGVVTHSAETESR